MRSQLHAQPVDEALQPPRHGHHQRAPQFGFHQCQGEVDASRGPRRGEKVAIHRAGCILGVQAVVIHLYSRLGAAHSVGVAPVGGVQPVEQPGMGQQQGAGADRAQAAHPGLHRAQPLQQLGIAQLL